MLTNTNFANKANALFETKQQSAAILPGTVISENAPRPPKAQAVANMALNGISNNRETIFFVIVAGVVIFLTYKFLKK